MPNAHSEYAFTFVDQHGRKDVPVYTGTDTLNSQYKSPRYWKWPFWDKRNLQGGLEYHLAPDNTLVFSVARKTRFATIKDRYSYSLGTAIPNPDLNAENTLNYDLGYRTVFDRIFSLSADLFYSHIGNTILNINHVYYDSVTKIWESQVQNVGRSEYIGGELSLEANPITGLRAGVNYTYIRRNNLSNPSILFTDVPRDKLFGFVQYEAIDRFYLQLNGEYDSKRYSTSYGAATGAFAVFNATASWHVWKYFSLEGGVNNIFDRNYSLVEGYPEAGRNFFVNLRYRY